MFGAMPYVKLRFWAFNVTGLLCNMHGRAGPSIWDGSVSIQTFWSLRILN